MSIFKQKLNWILVTNRTRYRGLYNEIQVTTPYTIFLMAKHISMTMDLFCISPFESSMRRAVRRRERQLWPDEDPSEDSEEDEAGRTDSQHQTTSSEHKYTSVGADVPPEYYEAILA